jgi:hypothetical protein
MQHPKDVDQSTSGGTDSEIHVHAIADEFAVRFGIGAWIRFGHWWASPHTRYNQENLSICLRHTYDSLQKEIVDPC